MRSLSLRRNFAWSLAGTFTYNMVQWLTIVVLARLGTKDMVGQFAFAQAVSAPVFLTVGLNLRVVRATDVRRVWSASQYRRLRMLLNVVAILLASVIGFLVGLREASLLVLFVVCLGKSAEATSQTLYGYFQIRDRLDLVSRSLLLRALLGTVGFVLGLSLTDDLVPACIGLASGWLLVYLLHDLPNEAILLQSDVEVGPAERAAPGTLVSLARKAAPLGIDAGVGSVATNVPRYWVQHLLGSAHLGAFVALAYLGQIVAMFTGALADSVIGGLARLADARDAKGFTRLLGLLVSFGAFVSTVSALGAWLFGEQIVRLLLGPDYVNQPVLILLMAGAGLITLQRCLGRGLQAAHRYQWVLVVDTVTLVATVAAGAFMIPAYGLVGASLTLGMGFGVGVLVAAAMLLRVVRSMSDEPRPTDRATAP